LPLLITLLFWNSVTKNIVHSNLFTLGILNSNGPSGRTI